MAATHLELIVEEPSMEIFLRAVLPKMIPDATTFAIHVYQGKHALLRKLGGRLRGYARWLPASARIVVLVDRDDDDCRSLKQTMERAAAQAGLVSRSSAGTSSWQVVNRIAIEELEAWFFGEWASVRSAYPRVPSRAASHAAYRNPDAIKGGTWEALERILNSAGYFSLGLRKAEIASAVGRHMNPDANTSPSFACFRTAVREATMP